MKKVFLMAAFVLVCSTGCFANETVGMFSSQMSSLPVKKTTKKATTKKASTKKTTSATKKSSTTTTSSSTVSATAATANSVSNASSVSKETSNSSTVSNVLGGLLGGGSSSTAGNVINGILNNVIGSSTFKKADLSASTWKYSKPGCAFTSENLLAKAGGEVAASKIENKLTGYYQKAGFSSSNTYFKFNEDGSFESKIDGKSWKGTYTFDEKTHAIQMKGLLFSISGFATRNTSGISLLFESKKLLTLIQTLTALSGNTTLSTIGNISKKYDGVRVGFDLKK